MLARLIGKSNIYNFKIEIFGDVKTFDFLKVEHYDNGKVLTQVTNITRDGDKLVGDCKIIGYRDSGVLKNIRTPFTQDADIEQADDEFIEDTIGLNIDDNNFIGVLEHHPDLKVCLDLKKAISKHIAILAKSGAGKSYTVGVILEEVMKKNIPIVILDPHNEYASLKYPNSDKKDLTRLDKFGLTPEGFLGRVREYSPDTQTNPQSEEITLDINKLKPQDLVESLPQKLSPAQQNIIFNILANSVNGINIDELIFNISAEESNAKWSLISQLEQLKKLKLYSHNPTKLTDIVKFKQCSIISLKGVEPYVSETFVAGLLRDLFEARKKDEIPPFLLVLEEAHNFCPERALGETKASKTIRTIAGEGRKFGLGLCCISQRPAKVDKNVVSQCTTQILLKMTNPNDIKSVIASSEGVSSDSEQEIQKLNIGSCLLTGVIDIPLKLNIRPRISKHGGDSVDITLSYEVDENENKPTEEKEIEFGANISYGGKTEESNAEQKLKDRVNEEKKKEEEKAKKEAAKPKSNGEFYQFIAPEVTLDEAKTMQKNDDLQTHMVPASLVKVKTKSGKEANILFDRVSKTIIKELYPFKGLDADVDTNSLSDTEKKLIPVILTLEDKFNPAELLIKTNVMFNEILRVCDNLTKRGLLKKVDKQYQIDKLEFVKKLDELNFFGNQKFEEIEFDKMHKEEISEKDVKEILELFSFVETIKDVYIIRYI